MKNHEMPNVEQPETFNTERLSKISSAYGISSLNFIHSPEKGITTENAVLEDDSRNRYFIKLYRDEKNEKYTSTYKAAELVATNEEVPVLLPLLSNDNSFTTSLDGHLLALFPYIEHETTLPINAEEDSILTSSIAKNLGRIHATPIPDDEKRVLPIERWQPASIEARKGELERLIAHISNLPSQTDFDLLALKSLTTKVKLLEELPHRSNMQTESRICHGDYHGHNILHDKDMEVVAIIDWDNAGLAEPYIDFLQTFMTNVIGKNYDNYQTERRGNAQTFVKCYLEGLGEMVDIERLKDAYHIFMNERIGTPWPLDKYYYNNKTNNINRLEHVLDRSITYAERYDEILNFILSIIQEMSSEDEVKKGSAK